MTESRIAEYGVYVGLTSLTTTNHWEVTMANNNPNHFSSFTGQQVNCLETIEDHLAKANALIQVALHEGFLDFSREVIHDYLLAVSDILENANRESIES